MNVWTTELRRGVVELCVLAVLCKEEGYGYEIIERLKSAAGLELTESTIYPLLARLTRDKLLTVRVAPSPSGPSRRYYQLTAAGQNRLSQMNEHWNNLTTSVSRLLKGDST